MSATDTVLAKLSCFVHGGCCISVIKSCLPECADVLFNVLFLLCWLLLISLTQSLLFTCVNMRDLFLACVEQPCVNTTDRDTTEVKFGCVVHCLYISVV